MASLELVDNSACLPMFADQRRAELALQELLAVDFHGVQISVTFDSLPVTSDLLPVTVALVPARSTAFSSVYGWLDLPLAAGRRMVQSLRSRRMVPLELVQNALRELLVVDFHSVQISITFDSLPVTSDLLPVTVALVPARSTAFSSVYGRVELPLATGRRAVHSLRSRKMAPLEMVQDAPREPLANDFHGENATEARCRLENPLGSGLSVL
ncbi:uncharacterized protein LOC132952837 [Metopolophium dirhodum]|uniref:uncharacterized protein LOC132952837 n=1 Tax=Metopolophium dirhodum TaxID=44670 RepID=UPI00298F8F15|nr:uncharacterized protein LOC132952837 [Metopolophium dirhodum]